MRNQIGLKVVGLALIAMSAFGQYGGYRRTSGKCTIEVEIDAAADVFVTGTSVQFRNLGGGAPPILIRTNCTAPLPAAPLSFRFHGRDGRGRQTLIAAPGSNHGTAVVRLEDPKPGRERFTFELYWTGGGAYNSGAYGYSDQS